MSISVSGLGKAGLPLAAVIADAKTQVIGIDLDEDRVKQINAGENPIPEEPGLNDLLSKHGNKLLKATTNPEDAKECTTHIIVVPLFIDDKKQPDFSHIQNAAKSVAKILKKDDLVVLETTVPVKTTEGVLKDALEKESNMKAGSDFHLAYSPERIMTGYSISRYKEFPKLVGGITNDSTDKAFEVYKKFANPVKVTDAKTAELAKVAEGIYRDVNIGLANELFKVSEENDVDFWEVKDSAKHEYCNILEPGNVGGHCIPVYPWFIINNHNVPLIKIAREVNDSMAEYYVEKAKQIGGKKAGVIGLSYREGVKEKAYTRSISIIQNLKKAGFEVFGLDPLYSKEETKTNFGIDQIESIDEMDVLLVLNKEIEYKNELEKIKDKVIDVKNILNSK